MLSAAFDPVAYEDWDNVESDSDEDVPDLVSCSDEEEDEHEDEHEDGHDDHEDVEDGHEDVDESAYQSVADVDSIIHSLSTVEIDISSPGTSNYSSLVDSLESPAVLVDPLGVI